MKSLSAIDGAFLFLETPHTPMHVASLHLFDLPPGCRRDFHAEVKRQMASRLLLENVLRHQQGAERDTAVAALDTWADSGTSTTEISCQPGRVLMHDTTSTPALVDIAAMRDALAEAGADPALLNPTLPVDVSIDHSLAVDAHAVAEAPRINLQRELRRNSER